MLNVLITGITSLLTDLSTEMVYPVIPLYLSRVLGATPAIVGLVEGLAESVASLLRVVSGYWSDRMQKRKWLAVFGYSFSMLGKLFLCLAKAWGMVLAGRVVDRLGKGVRSAPRDALIADSTPLGRRGRAFGLHRALDTLGAAAGVLVAIVVLGGVSGQDQAAPYLRLFLLSLIPAGLGVGVLCLARDIRQKPEAERGRLVLRWQLLPQRLKLFLGVVLLFALGNSSNQFLILRAMHVGFSVKGALLLYLVYNLSYALVSYPAGRLSDRFGRRRVLVLGYLFYGMVYFGFALARAPAWLWVLFGAYGFYSALTEGVEKALVADVAPCELRGTAIGLHALLTGIGLLPASLVAGALMTWRSSAPFYFGGMLGLLAAGGLMVVLAREGKAAGCAQAC